MRSELQPQSTNVNGEFVTLDGERYYAITNVDKMPPFLVSLASDSDHWMFIASNGGLTAGRVSPETALFPYITVDRIYESTLHTGCRTILRLNCRGQTYLWQPFNPQRDSDFTTTRNLFKNTLGSKILFEEVNHDLQLAFRYSWTTSDDYGFVRSCELENLGRRTCQVELMDGLLNILPAGTPRHTQSNASYLVDAYKWNELDEPSGLACYTLFSGITDRAEPCESLRANTVFCLGLEERDILLSAEQLDNFIAGVELNIASHTRGLRGAYLVRSSMELAGSETRRWQLVANVERSQVQTVALLEQLGDPAALGEAIADSIAQGRDRLARILAAADAFQVTNEENVSTHHYANTLYNVFRGGIFDNQYQISSRHFTRHVRLFNRGVFERHRSLLENLPEQMARNELHDIIRDKAPLTQLERLTLEYLPVTFGRRHGDPSRPWNQFAIALRDEHGNALLNYQGNWRDIFQNWEALLFSYPEFIEGVIAKFVNASTVDGYNPYRITNEGIDWEIEDPDDPWSYIGYWGDHQIIYLLKLLELSRQFYPQQLAELLQRPIFSYANVPYRIKPLQQMISEPKRTVVYDTELARQIEQRVEDMGSDGKLVLDGHGDVYQVNLLEKLLVTLLSKLGNLVVDGGIWLNTQRPEWNDANNALVGQGLSMVTLYYLRRYLVFLGDILREQSSPITLSAEVSEWLIDTAAALAAGRERLEGGAIDARQRYQLLEHVGQVASDYRDKVYAGQGFSGTVDQAPGTVRDMLQDAMALIDHSIAANRRDDGLYHAYNLLDFSEAGLEIDYLYPMLEGQVAALSSGALPPQQVADIVDTLYDSTIYRPDQDTFLLYPDRDVPHFLQKNTVPEQDVLNIPLLAGMLRKPDSRIIERDLRGTFRFNPALVNVDQLNALLESLQTDYGELVTESQKPLQALYEKVFQHRAFTGRSGGMFAFEGLGSIYWHMVSKLLLAVQENYFSAVRQGEDIDTVQRLGKQYYRIREGIGFNKTPLEYGAFPTDPYSHTPAHIGAQQPGMTGQVKEEILTRFNELGLQVRDGGISFDPSLLRAREFRDQPGKFRYLGVSGEWEETSIPASGLAFTWSQVPFVYQLEDVAEPVLELIWRSGERETLPDLKLPAEQAGELFRRSGRIARVELSLTPAMLMQD